MRQSRRTPVQPTLWILSRRIRSKLRRSRFLRACGRDHYRIGLMIRPIAIWPTRSWPIASRAARQNYPRYDTRALARMLMNNQEAPMAVSHDPPRQLGGRKTIQPHRGQPSVGTQRNSEDEYTV